MISVLLTWEERRADKCIKEYEDVSPEERPKVGQMVNEARALIEAKLEETKKRSGPEKPEKSR